MLLVIVHQQKYCITFYFVIFIICLLMDQQYQTQGESKIIANEQLIRIQGSRQREALHRSIGALTFIGKDGQMGFGSAVLISSNIILTAAHNIFSRKHKSQNKDFRFLLPTNGVIEEQYEIQTWRYPLEFEKCWHSEQFQFDFALMKLKESIVIDKNLPLQIPCPQCVWQKQISVFGFPNTYKNYVPLEEGRRQLYQYGLSRYGRIVESNNLWRICYRISTLPGQSGSPVLMDGLIIGIHIGGESQFNTGRIIDKYIIDYIKDWRLWFNYRNCPHEITLAFKGIQTVDLPDYINVLRLNLRENNIKVIDLTNFPRLTQLNLQNNQLDTLDVCSNIHLVSLRMRRNGLRKLNLSNNKNLTQLSLDRNSIEQIDVSRNVKLEQLELEQNKISVIDLSKNTSLKILRMCNNNISEIDLSNNKKMSWLDLQGNKLQQINLRDNPLLENLFLLNNSLTQIDLVNNPLLAQLYLNNNCLAQIDLRNNSSLHYLSLNQNQLESIVFDIPSYEEVKTYTIKEENNYNFSFSNQQSSQCQVRLMYDGSKANVIVEEVVKEWKARCTNKKQNQHNCKYSFLLIMS